MEAERYPLRVLIVGKSGSGKSTLAKKLSQLLGIEHVEFDSLYWKPNWQSVNMEEMRIKVDAALPANGEWIADGNYRRLADITWARAQIIVWLDYPIWFVLWRLLRRSLWRIWTQERVCNGNAEGWVALFGRDPNDNMLLSCLLQRSIHSREYPRLMENVGRGKVMRFRCEAECLLWLQAMERSVNEQPFDLRG